MKRHSFTLLKIALSRGFTLMEMLLSSAIAMIVLLLLVGIVEGAFPFWGHGKRHHEALGEIGAGLQNMTRDLYSAVITTNPDSLLIEQGDSKEDGTSSCKRLFFLVSHVEDRRQSEAKGDLCAVGYFIAVNPDGDGSRNLYRFHASGDQVVLAVENGKLESLYAQASPTNTATTELLARNIIDFEVHALPEKSACPELLKITLSTLNGDTERLLASKSGETAPNAILQKTKLLRTTRIVHLPPLRETSQGL